MKSLIQFLLKISARRYLARRQTKVIAVSGSVGKSTTTEMIAFVLDRHFRVRKGEEGYNNEYGLPLSILGLKSVSGAKRWIRVAIQALYRGFLQRRNKKDPEVIVLEMGADQPGDLRYLTSIARPDIAVLTNISTSHLENYPNLEALAREKLSIFDGLKRKGTAIINIDDHTILKYLKALKHKKIVSIGESETANYQAYRIRESETGLEFIIRQPDDKSSTALPLLGRHHIYPVLSSVAVAHELGISLSESIRDLADFQPPAGRMSILKGIKNSTIIDSSYNSSPLAMESTLSILRKFKNKKKVLLLGDMRELGYISENEHIKLASYIIPLKPELIILVGEQMKKYLAPELLARKFPEKNLLHFRSSREAGKYLQKKLPTRSILLAKGSQNTIFLEESIAMLLVNKKDQAKLCRQTASWKKKKNVFFRRLK